MKNYKIKLHQFLEKNRKIIKDTGFLFFGRAIQKLLSLLVIYVLVRALSQESYGEYSFVMSVVALSSIFTLSGIGNSLIQSVSRGFLGTYKETLKYTLGGSIIASLILLSFGFYYQPSHPDMAISFMMVGILIPFTYGLAFWKSVYAGEERFKELSIIMFLMDSLKSISIISLIYYQDSPSIIIPALVMFLVPAVFNVYLTFKAMRLVPKDAEIEEGSIQYGLKTTFFSAFNLVANKIDAMLIFFILSPVSLAIYAIAERISEIVKEGVNDLGLIMAPKFARQKEYTQRIRNILKIFSAFIVAGILFLAFILLPLCIEFLFGAEYLPSLPYTQVLLLSIAISVFHNFQFRYVMSKLDSKSFKDFNIYTSLVRIALSVVLIPILGIWGAVISTVLYRVFSILFIEYIMRTKYKPTLDPAV